MCHRSSSGTFRIRPARRFGWSPAASGHLPPESGPNLHAPFAHSVYCRGRRGTDSRPFSRSTKKQTSPPRQPPDSAHQSVLSVQEIRDFPPTAQGRRPPAPPGGTTSRSFRWPFGASRAPHPASRPRPPDRLENRASAGQSLRAFFHRRPAGTGMPAHSPFRRGTGFLPTDRFLFLRPNMVLLFRINL